MIKQGINGRPGSANNTCDFTVLQLCVASAVKMTNKIPARNIDILSPSDFLNPQEENYGGVIEPATCCLADLKERKLLLQEKMEILQNTRLEEMRLDYQRFLKTRIKSGQNKSPMSLAVGDLIMHKDGPFSMGEFGVVKGLSRGTALVRFKNREVYIGAAALAPIATAQFALISRSDKSNMDRLNQPPSNFISIKVSSTAQGIMKEVEHFQEWIQEGAGNETIGNHRN